MFQSLNIEDIFLNYKTTISYETRKLSDLEFPMYFSLVPNPGYNRSSLDMLGFQGEWDLFWGHWAVNETPVSVSWGKLESIKGYSYSHGLTPRTSKKKLRLE